MLSYHLESDEEGRKSHDKSLLIGSLPDSELRILPRWLFFNSSEGYNRPQYTYFMLENRNNASIVFRFRTKDRQLMLFSPSYGFIAPHESVKVIMVLTAADTWQRDPASYVGKIHKVVAENMIMNKELKVPEEIKKQKALCRELFATTRQATGNRSELNIYTKMRVILPFYDFNTRA